ncbi:MAG: DEAD/DEAH box helicase [Pedosphaera sp.]|nr:DEAD/DEAH box helicase [Pedosphaera sp.]
MSPRLFSELGLSPEVQRAIKQIGFEQATPIQAEAIPVLLTGRDAVGQSQTGSGKTAAFAVPAIEKVDAKSREVQVLILCPTRELAVQVSEEVHKLSVFKTGVRALPIYGGQSYERQFAGLKAGSQIVIGTPGRVIDHIKRGTLRLAGVKMVILDEADKMLDMGFREDIEEILSQVPKERQTVLFSATVPRVIQDLIRNYTRDPQWVRIEQKAMTVPTVEQVYYEVDRRWKFEALTRLIDLHNARLGIIFCNTQRMVDELTGHMNAAGYEADALHGGMTQGQRDRVMNKFRKSGLEFLVATDIAARGLDVDDIQVVFNYDMPYDGEDYVHRIGRTGRAGRSGLAISFASGREVFAIRQIERFTLQRIRRGQVPTDTEIESARVNQVVQRLRDLLQRKDFPKREHIIEALLEEGFDSMDLISALLHQAFTGEEGRWEVPEAGKGAKLPASPLTTAPAKPLPRLASPAPTPPLHSSATPAPKAAPKAAPDEDAPLPVRRIEKPAKHAETSPKSASDENEAPPDLAPPEEVAAPRPVTPHSRKSLVSLEVPPARATRTTPSSTPAPMKAERASSHSSAPAAPAFPARPVRDYSPRGDLGRPEPRPPYRRDDDPADRRGPAYADRPSGPRRYDRPPVPARAAQRPYRETAPAVNRPVRPTQPESEQPASDGPIKSRPTLRPDDDKRRPWQKFQRLQGESRFQAPIATVQLRLNVGSKAGIEPSDIVGSILGETGLDAINVGQIEVGERTSTVEVASQHSRAIVAKLNRARIKGQAVKARIG